jgi:hypothetical protein
MRRVACYSLLIGIALSQGAFAQDQPSGFHSVACLKLQPGKAREFREFTAAHTRKVMQAAADTGDFSGWYLVRSVFPVGTEARCDYYSVITYKGVPLPPLGGERFEAALKKSGVAMTAADYLAKRNTLATLVSSEMWRTAIQIAAPEKGDFMYMNSMKVHNMNDWMGVEQKVWKPMAELWVKDGSMRAWMVNRAVLPSGTDLKYQAMTVDVFPSWESVFKPRSVSEIFKKIHPNLNMEETFERISKSRDLARRELLTIEDKVVAAGAAVVSQK